MKQKSKPLKYTSEAALLKALKIGEAAALEQIFNEHYNLMLRTASNIVVDNEKAKDIVQEVFEQLWTKRFSLNITSSLKPYLSRAVANRSINEYKRLRKRNEVNEAAEHQDDQNIHQQVEFKELDKRIQDAIETLPDRCRAVFIKSRMEGKSHQEIADELNISKKTIENQITKALKKMRIIVANYNQDAIILVFLFSLIRG